MPAGPTLGAEHGIQVRAMRDWLRWLGAASPGARTIERDGVTAAVVPAVPQRSIANGVVFETAADLASAYDDLASTYDEAGVAAWTVWVPDFDRDAIAMLEGRGHRFDGDPVAMVCDLADVPERKGELDWDSEATPEEVGRLNDLAYGLEGAEGMAAAFGPAPAGLGQRRYRARVDGELACVLATMDHGDDTGVYFVATHPEHRGARLASTLLALALAEARSRGRRTASLQASAMGAGLYRRLGFRDAYRVLMYERRGG
jgi:ribosomal protein S18 acetylase RimI-like enzyme